MTTTVPEVGFPAAISAAPDDALIRLAYADYLDEDPRNFLTAAGWRSLTAAGRVPVFLDATTRFWANVAWRDTWHWFPARYAAGTWAPPEPALVPDAWYAGRTPDATNLAVNTGHPTAFSAFAALAAAIAADPGFWAAHAGEADE